jgi:CRISPR-associated endonuclease Csn1
MPEVRNPTINRTLNEVRKVVNNLIAMHGRPDRIHVELARELKLSPRRIEEIQKEQKQQEGMRNKAKEDLREKNIPESRREVVLMAI